MSVAPALICWPFLCSVGIDIIVSAQNSVSFTFLFRKNVHANHIRVFFSLSFFPSELEFGSGICKLSHRKLNIATTEIRWDCVMFLWAAIRQPAASLVNTRLQRIKGQWMLPSVKCLGKKIHFDCQLCLKIISDGSLQFHCNFYQCMSAYFYVMLRGFGFFSLELERIIKIVGFSSEWNFLLWRGTHLGLCLAFSC